MPDVELISEPSVVQALAKAEIDQQIATAKEYPRDVARSIDNATKLATMTPEIAEECNFSLPRSGRDIEGPSVRLAEILVSTWGNLRVQSRVIETGDRYVTVQGTAHDLESNSAIQKEVQRRITGRNGRRFGDDMILTTTNAASSIAFRNAVFAAIPKAVWMPVYQAALKTAGSGPLPERRQRALDWFGNRGVDVADILRTLKVEAVGDITQEHLQTLSGFRNAIREEATTVQEVFGLAGGSEMKDAAELQAERDAIQGEMAEALGGKP